MAKYNVHAGHAKPGAKYCGAVGLIDESKEDRIVKDAVIKYLKLGGATVYDCTVDSGTSQTNVLSKICTKCNEHTVTMDFSIHFNSGRADKLGDNKQGGFEIFATKYDATKKEVAGRIIEKMNAIGIKNHGDPYKTSSSLYYLNHTSAKALLLEICFVDDKDDVNWYKEIGADAIGKAIAEGILNKKISSTVTSVSKDAATVTASSLNMRKSNSASSGIITSISKGEKVTVLSKGEAWTKCSYKEYTGYCSTKYLSF